MSYERKSKDRESRYSNQSSSYISSMPRWVDMATFKDGYDGYQYTDHWGQLSLKYAPSYYKNEHLTKHSQSMSDSSSAMKSDLSDNQIARRRQRFKIAFILVVVSILAVAAVIIPVLVVFLKPADTQPEQYLVATMNVTVIETYRDEYNNKSSPEYKSFEQNFTNAMDQIYKESDITGYNGIQIQSLRNGSIIVTFIIVIVVKRAEESPGEQALKAVIIEQPKDKSDNTIVVVTNFKIQSESVSVALIEYVQINPITPEATTTTTTLAITTPTLKPSTQARTTTMPNTTATPSSASTPLPTNASTTTTKSTSTAATTITTKRTTNAITTSPSTSESSTTSTKKSDPTTTTQTSIATSTSSSTTSITSSTHTTTTTPTSTPANLNTTTTTTLSPTTITQPSTTRATSAPTPEANITSIKTSTPTTATQPTVTNATNYSTILSTTESKTTTTTKSTPTTTIRLTTTSSMTSSTTEPNTTSTTPSTHTTPTLPTSTGSTLTTSTGLNTTSISTSTPKATLQTSTDGSTSALTPEANTTSTKTSITAIATQPATTNATHYSTISSSNMEPNTTTTTQSTPTTTTQTAITSSTSSSTTKIATSTSTTTTRASSTGSTLPTPPELSTANTTLTSTTTQPSTTRSTSTPTPEPNINSTTTSIPTTSTRPTTTSSMTSSTTEPNTTSTTASTHTTPTLPTSTGSTLTTSTGLTTTSMSTSTPTITMQPSTAGSTSARTPEANTTSTKTSITTIATQPATTNTTHYSTLLSSTTEPNNTTTTLSTPTTTTQTAITRSTSSSTTKIATSTSTTTTRASSTSSTLSTPPELSTANTTLTSTTTQPSTTRSTSTPTPEANINSTTTSIPTTSTPPTTTSSMTSSTTEPNTTSTTASTHTTTTFPTSTRSTLTTSTGLNTTSMSTSTPTINMQPSTAGSTLTLTPEANTTSTKTSVPSITTQPPTTNATYPSTILSSTPASNITSTTQSTPTTTTQPAIISSISSSTTQTNTDGITTSAPTFTTLATSTGSTLSTQPEMSTTGTTSSTPTTTTLPSTTESSSASTPGPSTISATTSAPTTSTWPTITSSTTSSSTVVDTTSITTSTHTTSISSASTGSTLSTPPDVRIPSTTTSTATTTTLASTTRSASAPTPEPNTTTTTTLATTQPSTTWFTSESTKEPNATSSATSTPTTTTQPSSTSTTHSSTILSSTPEFSTTSMKTSIPTTTTTSTTTTSALTPEPNSTSTAASKTTTITQPTITGSSSSISELTSTSTGSTLSYTTSTITSTLSPLIQPSTAEATVNVTLDETFKPEYVNSSSSEYKSFVQNFTSAMDQIYMISNITGYNGIQIQELRNGSVIVIFVIIIELKQDEKPPQAEALVAVITQQPTDQVDTAILVISNLRIRKASVTVVTIVAGIPTPITTSTTARITSTRPTTTPTTTTTPVTSKTTATVPETSMMTTVIPTMTTTHISSTSSIQDMTTQSTTLTPSVTTQPATSTTLTPSVTTQPIATYDTSSPTLQQNSTSPTAMTTTATTLQNATNTTYSPTPQFNASSTQTSASITTTQPLATSTSLQPTTEPNTANTTTATSSITEVTTLTTIVTTTTTSSSVVIDTTTKPTTFIPGTTTDVETSVAFSKDNYTYILGTPLQLTCMVTGWDGNLNISRVSKLSQSEVNVVSLVNNETGIIHAGFAVNKTFSESIVHVFIFILNMTCDDEGTYYCKSGSASDSATVKREREKPTLQLPDIMIRDEYHSDKYPFVCEAEVETPGEVLIAEVNRNGTYYHYEGYGENRQNNTIDCVQKQIFKFYINGKFTQEWDNAKIRCVVMNNLTNVEDNILLVSDENTIRLLPDDICSGVADGSNIRHPYSACELFLTCQSGVPVLGKCQQGQCFYDNIGTCREPKCPFLYCRDTEVNIGDRASITCEILFCNDSFSLSIKRSEVILFSNVNISGNISLKSDDKDIQISVSRGAAAITLTLNKTNCNDTGEYIIDLDMARFIDLATLRLKVPPKIPTLQLPQSIVAYTETTISCTGELGVPQQDIYIEVMFNSSNFSKYDKTTLTRNSKNCSNIGTLVMNFLVEDMWDGARIRCVIGDNSSSRMESDVHGISITYTGVRFSTTKYTGLINGTVQMNCIVNGVFNGDDVIISRSNSGILGEETLSIITVGNSTGSNLTGIRISTTNLSVNEMIVHVNIDPLQCHYGGAYYCKTGNRTATTTLEIWRKPDKPKLKLPLDVISDGYNQGGDPFVCEGNVGYPGGNLTVLFNKDGSFKKALPFIANMTTGNVTECGRVDRFEFYLNKFTTDLHNSTVRCVATNENTLSNESAPFDDKILLLVPGNTCYDATEGLILPYPYRFYDCGKYLYCSWNRTFVKDGRCKDGECYYTDTERCEQERTTTTTKPTTTTHVACPSVACSGAEPVINSAATITCALILCGDEFDLVIELDSKVQFRETMRGNRTSSFLSNALLNLVVKDKTAELNIVFENILCNQSGAYNVSIYGGNVSSVAAIRVRVNPEKPNITAPPNIYKDQKTIISCIGQLGIPNASMFWQLMLPGGNFESYSVSGSPDISKSDCSVIGKWTIGIYPEQSWNGGGIRCVTKTQGNPSVEIYSDAITITLEEPDIYFLPSSSSGYIGSSHSITCIATDMMNIVSVRIERQTTSGLHQVASLAIDGTSVTNFIGIRIRNTSTINSTAATVYTDFDNLTCADKGYYFCTIGAFSSRGNLSVLRKPEVPQMVTFPTSGILENTNSGTINCTGEVGYPARKIVFESNKGGNNTFNPVPFSFTSTQMEGECSTTYSATFSYMFHMDWNSTVIRCKIDTGDVLDDSGSSLYVDRKVLIIPGNICETSNAEFVPHPYACQKYVRCASSIFLQECSPTLCHLTVPDNFTACGYCNGCIDSF